MSVDSFVDSEGTRIAVRDHGGAGVPIVLVHGHLGNLAEWDELGPILTQSMRVVAYDQRGQGWSERGPVSVAGFVADLAAVASAFDLDRPIVFGSSFGARVCLAYAQFGGPIRALINQDGPVADPVGPGAMPTHPQPPAGRTVLGPSEWDAYLAGMSAVGPVGAASARRAAVRVPGGSVEVRPSREQLYEKEQAFQQLSIVDGYRSVAGPILVLAARRREHVDEREAAIRKLEEHLQMTVRWFDTGHWISAEDVDGVAEAIASFGRRLA